MLVNKLFTYLLSHVRISRKVKVFYCEIFDILFSYEEKMLADFQICISVSLSSKMKWGYFDCRGYSDRTDVLKFYCKLNMVTYICFNTFLFNMAHVNQAFDFIKT